MRSDYGPDDLDPGLLLWDVRRFLAPGAFGDRRVVIQLTFPSMPPNSATTGSSSSAMMSICA